MTLPGLNQSLTMWRLALCSSPSIWMSVFTGVSPAAASFAFGARAGIGAFVKISGLRSISITSACLVIAQNSG